MTPPAPDEKLVCDARDPDYSRPGMFAHHNCWRCKDGSLPCPDGQTGPSRNCEYPHARND